MDPMALAQAALFVIPLALSLVVQAYARAQVAVWLGDDTPRRDGRLSLDPSAHVDLVGTFLLPMALFLLQGASHFLPLLGWAKPVDVRVERMRRGIDVRRLEMLVAAAAPLASLTLAALSALGLVLIARLAGSQAEAPMALCLQLLSTNVALAIFQLLPIGPLAGFVILKGLVPRRAVEPLVALNDAIGQWALLALLFFGRGLLAGPSRFVATAFVRVVGGL